MIAVPSRSGRNQGKIWLFGGDMVEKAEGVAVDLQLPEKPKRDDGK